MIALPYLRRRTNNVARVVRLYFTVVAVICTLTAGKGRKHRVRQYGRNHQCYRGKDSAHDESTEPRPALPSAMTLSVAGMLTVDFPAPWVHAVHVLHLELCWYIPGYMLIDD